MTFGRCGAWPSKNYCSKATSSFWIGLPAMQSTAISLENNALLVSLWSYWL